MFRLIFGMAKLAVLGLVGYAIYEFVRGAGGMVQRADMGGMGGGGHAMGGGHSMGGAMPRNLHEGDPARANMTGGGEGMVVESLEYDGGSVPHAVGRGVVRR